MGLILKEQKLLAASATRKPLKINNDDLLAFAPKITPMEQSMVGTSKSVVIYLGLDGQQKGPFEIEQIQAMWSEGKITPQTLCWQEGSPTWEPFANISESFGIRIVTPPSLPVQLPPPLPANVAPTFKSETADLRSNPVLRVRQGESEEATMNAYMKALRANTHFPIVTTIIVVLCIVVFVLMWLSDVSISDPSPEDLLGWGANYAPYTTDGQWWRLITACFVHIGIMHIALNMWCLVDLGSLAERFYGNVRFLGLYVASAVGVGIASCIFHPNTVSAGASGAVFGVAGGLLALFLRKKESFPHSIFKEHKASFLSFIGFNLFYGMIHPGIDNAAHIGGLLVGFGAGLLMASSSLRAIPSIVVEEHI